MLCRNIPCICYFTHQLKMCCENYEFETSLVAGKYHNLSPKEVVISQPQKVSLGKNKYQLSEVENKPC